MIAKGGWVKTEHMSPVKLKETEFMVEQMKIDYTRKIDKLNFEIFDLRQKETAHLRIIEADKKRNAELSSEYDALEEAKRVPY